MIVIIATVDVKKFYDFLIINEFTRYKFTYSEVSKLTHMR
jgi:hypothetical protein